MTDTLGKQLMDFIDKHDTLCFDYLDDEDVWDDDAEVKLNEFLDKAIDEMLQQDGRLNLGKADTHG